MRQLFALVVLCFVGFSSPAIAAPSYPALTGRVVDKANLLSPATEQTLTENLAALERRSGNQLVIVTVPDLAGIPIEEYGVGLGRHWKIGKVKKNNGSLLIVAPKEHAVRIEVGYGLEGLLTDALARQVIEQAILPSFKAGNMEQGIVSGTDAVISILDGKGFPATLAKAAATASGSMDMPSLFFIFCIFVWIVLRLYFGVRGNGRFGGGSGSKFRGGGGGFGGGGASGRW